MDLSEDKCLPGTHNPNMQCYLESEYAFGLQEHLFKSIGEYSLTVEKNIQNYCVSRA